MIARHQFMAYLKEEYAEEHPLQSILASDRAAVAEQIRKKHGMTVALYRYQHMIFLYYEGLHRELVPQTLFPALTACLESVPVKGGHEQWLPMHTVYYNAVPKSVDSWQRVGKKERIGRIAYLIPDKLVSYLYYHKELLEEGLFEGERYLSIGLYDTILFTYSESPRVITHLRLESAEESTVITRWRQVDPKSHFDHSFSGSGNFLDLEELLSLGWEEVFDEP